MEININGATVVIIISLVILFTFLDQLEKTTWAIYQL